MGQVNKSGVNAWRGVNAGEEAGSTAGVTAGYRELQQHNWVWAQAGIRITE